MSKSMMVAERTQLLKDLADEAHRITAIRVRDKISSAEAETVRSELLLIAEGLVSKFGLTIPEARRLLHELLDVSV